MKRIFGTFISLWSIAALIAACAGEKALDIVPTNGDFTGYIVTTTVATDPATGPGLAALFNPAGQLVRIIRDYYATSEFPTGSAFVGPDRVMLSVDGSDRMELWSLTTGSLISPITNSNLGSTTAPLKQIVRDPVDGSIYIVEPTPNTVEKFTVSANGGYSRAGNPFIATTTSTCVLAAPWGITINPNTQRVYVMNSAAAGKIAVYDKDGNCVQYITSAPLTTNTPQSIAYHSASNKLIVGFIGNHAIYSMNLDGTSPQQIFLNAAIINTPRAIATDKDGYIYVSSAGTDTIEKLYYDGGLSATRALPGPLIGPSITSQNATSVMVIQ